MRYLSLFSGIEAASAAWAQLGWECAGVAEIEPFPCQLLKQKYPKVPNLGDITKITEDDIAALGRIDLVVFGSPCQDLSVAGKRKGLDGARSGLFFEAMRIVAIARARSGCRWALWENVFGAFSSNKGLDFAAVVDAMVGLEIGTTTPTAGKKWGNEGCAVGPDAMVEWGTLDAQWFGVAQRRRRVFALADFGDWANRPPILLEPQSMRGNSAPRREAGESVARATAIGVALRGREEGGTAELGDECGGALRASGGGGDKPYVLVSEQRSVLAPHGSSVPPIAMCLNAGGMGRIDYESETMIVCATGQVTHTLKADGFDASEDGTGRGTPIIAFNSNAKPDEMRFNPRVATSLTCSQSSAIGYEYYSHDYCQDRIYSVEAVSPALNCSQEHVVRTEGGVRRLTPRECERLQAFPDDHTRVSVRGKPAADGPRYKALGNSMCVNVMRWIGKQIDFVHEFC